jgi:integrase
MTIRRNRTLEGPFTFPKALAGERIISPLAPALDVIKPQKSLTFMLSPIEIDVLQREHGKLHRYFIRPIFSPNRVAIHIKH